MLCIGTCYVYGINNPNKYLYRPVDVKQHSQVSTDHWALETGLDVLMNQLKTLSYNDANIQRK